MLKSIGTVTIILVAGIVLGALNEKTTSSLHLTALSNSPMMAKSPLAPPDKGSPDDTIGGTTRTG